MIGGREFRSRLILGTGGFPSLDRACEHQPRRKACRRYSLSARLPVHAKIFVRDVEQAGSRRIGRGVPILAARGGRADVAHQNPSRVLFRG